MSKSIFKVLKTKPKVKKLPKKETKKTEDVKKIAYILATMRFKKNTIMFVRSLSRIIEDKRQLSKNQRHTLHRIYAEWMAGKPKAIEARKANKARKVLKK